MTRREVLTNVISWNRRTLKKAQGEKNEVAIKRLEGNILTLEKELTNVG